MVVWGNSEETDGHTGAEQAACAHACVNEGERRCQLSFWGEPDPSAPSLSPDLSCCSGRLRPPSWARLWLRFGV